LLSKYLSDEGIYNTSQMQHCYLRQFARDWGMGAVLFESPTNETTTMKQLLHPLISNFLIVGKEIVHATGDVLHLRVP